jgi:hypothetical protein
VKLRDRRDRKAEQPGRDLPPVLERLHEVRAKLPAADMAVSTAEQAEAEGQASLVSDEFHGHVPEHEAARKRSELTAAAVAARRERDHLAELARVGEAEALKLVDEIHGARGAARQQEIDAAQQDRADAIARQLGAEARLQRLADERFDDERAHMDARRIVQVGEPVDWEQKDRETIRKWIEGVRHQAAGTPPLPARLQSRGEAELRRLESEGVSREYLESIAERSGYVLLDNDGGPVRLPDAHQPRRR